MAETILLTGAAGRIGTMMRPRLAKRQRTLRLLDIQPMQVERGGEQIVQGSITDLASMIRACSKVDAVIHLAGEPNESDWERILELNINGTRNVFEAARQQGVPRVIFASSNHAVGFFPASAGEAPDYLFPRPDTYYGVSKVAGEGLGSMYHDRWGMDVACLRILSCEPRPSDVRHLATWLSPDDAARLFEAALAKPDLGFRVVWGVSNNIRRWFSLREGNDIGYFPQDDAEVFAGEVLAANAGLTNPAHLERIGGKFCGPEMDVNYLPLNTSFE